MGEITKNMDSVFDNSMNDTVEFDVLFDQEDSLIDTVCGVDESGNPLTGVDFDTLHQTHDDATVKDVKDVEADDDKFGAPNPEGTKKAEVGDNTAKGELGKESDGDKVRKDADQNYQDGKEGKDVKPDENDLNGTIDKVAENNEYDDIDAEVMADDDDFEEAVSFAMGESCKKEECTDGELCEKCGKNPCECATVKKESTDGSVCPKCGMNPCVCGKGDIKVGNGCEDNGVDSIEAEIERESKKGLKESGEVDSDVEKMDDADLDGEDKNIEDASNSNKQSMANKYSYDVGDEELISIAMGE